MKPSKEQKNSVSERDSLLRRLVNLFRLFQKKNRFVGTAHDTGLELMDSHALIELDLNPDIGSKDMQRVLGITKSASFRLFHRLKGKGLVKASARSEHSGRHRFSPTFLGRTSLQALDVAANENLKHFAAALSDKECWELHIFLSGLADWYRAAPSRQRTDEHPLRAAIRRLTRAFGLLGESILGSNLSSVKWHALHEVANNPTVRFNLDLCRVLNISPTTASYTVRALERDGLLRRIRSEQDARYSRLRITPKGQAALERVNEAFMTDLRKGLEALGLNEIKRFAELMERLTGSPADSLEAALAGYEIRPAVSSVERADLRRFLVREIINDGGPDELAEVLFGGTSLSFGLYKDENLTACLEVAGAQKDPTITNLSWRNQAVSKEGVKTFVLDCINQVLSRSSSPRVLVGVSGKGKKLIQELSNSHEFLVLD